MIQWKEKKIDDEIKSTVVPTKYQDKRTYYLITKYIDSLRKPAKQLGVHKRLPNLKYITLLTNDINAEVFVTKCNEKEVIIFNKRLFDFCLMMGKIAASNILVIEEGGKSYLDLNINHIADNLKKNKAILTEFATLLLMFSNKQEPDTPFHVADYQSVIATNIMLAAEFFTLSHEYCHLFFGHNENLKRRFEAEILDSNSKKRKMLYRWKNEIEADTLGLNLLMEYYENKKGQLDAPKRYFNMTAGIFFLKCLEILEKTSHIVQNLNTKIYSSELIKAVKEFTTGKTVEVMDLSQINRTITDIQHPPAEIRYNLLHDFFVNKLNKKSLPNDSLDQVEMGLILVDVLDILYDSSREVLLEVAKLLNKK